LLPALPLLLLLPSSPDEVEVDLLAVAAFVGVTGFVALAGV
jgi:hypothetical protein